MHFYNKTFKTIPNTCNKFVKYERIELNINLN